MKNRLWTFLSCGSEPVVLLFGQWVWNKTDLLLEDEMGGCRVRHCPGHWIPSPSVDGRQVGYIQINMKFRVSGSGLEPGVCF